jgi:hypothetical protein
MSALAILAILRNVVSMERNVIVDVLRLLKVLISGEK